MNTEIDPFVSLVALGLVAIVFARAALEKTFDFAIYAATMRDYRLLPEALVPMAAAALLAAEVATIVMIVLPATRSFGAALAIGLLALYAAAMARVLLAGRNEIECGCGGQGQIVSWELVGRNIVLAAIAAVVLAPTTVRALDWFDDAEIACAIAIAWVALASLEQIIETQAAVRRLRVQAWL